MSQAATTFAASGAAPAKVFGPGFGRDDEEIRHP